MARTKRDLFWTVLVVPLILGCLGVAQEKPPADAPPTQPYPPNHGLSLTLAKDSTGLSSTMFKDCLASHPEPACALFTTTLSNAGSETPSIWGLDGCPGWSPQIEYQQTDGSWKAFPRAFLFNPIRACNMIPGKATSFPPKETRVFKSYLAALGLDVTYQRSTYQQGDDVLLLPRCMGCAWLDAQVPHVIRARSYLIACIATEPSKSADFPNALYPFDCETGKKQQAIELLSNSLSLD